MTRIVLAALVLAALPAAAATTTVTLDQPERFSDVGRDRRHAQGPEDVAALQEHIRQRASAWLPPGDRHGAFLMHARLSSVDDPARFEKALLDRWMRREFARATP